MAVDKEQLLQARLAEGDVEVPALGTVRVRALSRAEVVDRLNTVDRSVPGAFETRLLALAVVDPALTEEESARWREVSEPNEIGAVIDKINELSLLTKDAAKATYKELEANPDAAFRDGPGGEALDDGGPAEG